MFPNPIFCSFASLESLNTSVSRGSYEIDHKSVANRVHDDVLHCFFTSFLFPFVVLIIIRLSGFVNTFLC